MIRPKTLALRLSHFLRKRFQQTKTLPSSEYDELLLCNYRRFLYDEENRKHVHC